jgi:hypothetical protein
MFDNFLRKSGVFFSKTNVIIEFLIKLPSFILNQKGLLAKKLKIHNIHRSQGDQITEFSPMGCLFTLGRFFKTTQVA